MFYAMSIADVFDGYIIFTNVCICIVTSPFITYGALTSRPFLTNYTGILNKEQFLKNS